MKKLSKIPTILGIVILLAGVFAGVFFLNMTQVFRIGADSSSAPKDIRVGNIDDTSVTISWTTDKESVGFVSWGISQGNTGKIEKESETDEKFFNHMVTLSGLSPSSTYYYKINSNGVSFDNGGIPWQFTSGPTLSASKNSMLVSGSVITPSGQPEKRALVYTTINGYLLSTLTSDTGNYVFQIGGVRTTNLSSYAQIDQATTLIEISVQAGPDGMASAQIFPKSANPVPPMVLGKVYDFRSLEANSNDQNPNANLNLPENTTGESKFNVESNSGTPAPTSVILENLTDGETVTSDTPQFLGKGPGGEEITITINSETPITDTVQIPSDGSWSWSPSSALAAGAHTITIAWKDATGITRSLTRNFVVQAGEAPAFTASESGSTASPTASPIGTTSPTIVPTPTIAETAEPVPVTGSLTPTLALLIMGVAVTLFSLFVWKTAES